MDDTDADRPQAATAGSERATARWATLPEPVDPDDMVEGAQVGFSPDPSTLRDTETAFLLRYGA